MTHLRAVLCQILSEARINRRYLSPRGSMTPLSIPVTAENITFGFDDIKKTGWNLKSDAVRKIYEMRRVLRKSTQPVRLPVRHFRVSLKIRDTFETAR